MSAPLITETKNLSCLDPQMRKDRTKDFLTMKQRINQYNNPAKRYIVQYSYKLTYRFEPMTNTIAFESFAVN
jgi:hypothetical protein